MSAKTIFVKKYKSNEFEKSIEVFYFIILTVGGICSNQIFHFEVFDFNLKNYGYFILNTKEIGFCKKNVDTFIENLNKITGGKHILIVWNDRIIENYMMRNLYNVIEEIPYELKYYIDVSSIAKNNVNSIEAEVLEELNRFFHYSKPEFFANQASCQSLIWNHNHFIGPDKYNMPCALP
jgi:hypothetical protein